MCFKYCIGIKLRVLQMRSPISVLMMITWCPCPIVQAVLLDIFDTDEDGNQRLSQPEDEAIKMGQAMRHLFVSVQRSTCHGLIRSVLVV